MESNKQEKYVRSGARKAICKVIKTCECKIFDNKCKCYTNKNDFKRTIAAFPPPHRSTNLKPTVL